LPVIQDNPFPIDGIKDAIQPRPVELILSQRCDDQIDLHMDPTQDAGRNTIANFLFRAVKDDSQIQVAVGAIIPSSTGAKQDNPNRVGCLDNAAHRLRHLLIRH
jgi:predicted deacylase